MATENFLDCARSPLKTGVNLIEASAGTGKTYAIAMLVLRCVSELAIPIEQVLVVTFTKAATEELRSRIRMRLVEARNLLRDSAINDDHTMQTWLETVTDKEQCLSRIQLALYDIDRAAIFTIHSFCQRMLQEQALESGQLFDVELVADIDDLKKEVVEDYWRCNFYSLPSRPCAILTDRYPTPERLYTSVAGVSWDYTHIEPQSGSIKAATTGLQEHYAALAAWWQQSSAQLYQFFRQTSKEGKFKQSFTVSFEGWWQDIDDYLTGTENSLPADLQYLTTSGLASNLNGHKVKKARQQQFLADWPLPEQQIQQFLQAADNLVLAVRRDLVKYIRSEIETRLFSRGHMSFDDLIIRLDHALSKGDDKLRTILQKRFNAALIDEFQDTDNAQWRIFSCLFAHSSHYLYLIGDPKQAIYRFRGADIYSYFKARKSADHQLSLHHNYRSHPHLVDEVNRLFNSRQDPFAFSSTLMPFLPVVPARTVRDGALTREDVPLAAMVYCRLPENGTDKSGRWTSGKASEMFRNYVVQEVLRLLDRAVPVVCREHQDQMSELPVQPKDIAVLVRNNRQAGEYLMQFAQAGIPAVLNSKISVFDTAECFDLYTLLRAIAKPGDGYRLKSAMTISWFDITGNHLQRIWQDEELVDSWFNRFLAYYQIWQEMGFLSMMSRLLVDQNVYLNIASGPLAERRIANIHHLLELIQEAESSEKLGPGQTLLWLRSRRAGKTGSEDRELRLESDEEAVRIVTMHSAKGMQYPVIFCPYLWYRSGNLRSENQLISCHDEENALVVDLGSDQFNARQQRALQEELAEEIRLVYVALTRAQLRCYTMWVDTKNHPMVTSSIESGLGYLLFEGEAGSYKEQSELFEGFAESEGVEQLLIETGQEQSTGSYSQVGDELLPLVPLSPGERSLYTDYQMSSYSAMAALSEHEDHGVELDLEITAEDPGAEILYPGLPAGANFGNLVHDSLEELSFASLSRLDDNSEDITRLLGRYSIDLQPEAVAQLLATIVNTPLLSGINTGTSFSLAQLDEQRCIKEMPFYFHLGRLGTDSLNSILADEPTVTPLSHRVMQGYLTGYIDLFCEHHGKFYILDYKTNLLGEHLIDYRDEKLVAAMATHNYGLQYWIYTLVLHRYLQHALPGYRYESHFGGVMYLFVRGMVPQIEASGVFATLPSPKILDLLDRAMGGEG